MRVIENDENNIEEIDEKTGKTADSSDKDAVAEVQGETPPESEEGSALPYSDEVGELPDSDEVAVVDESVSEKADEAPVDEELLAKARGEAADEPEGGEEPNGSEEELPYSNTAAESKGDDDDAAVLDEIESPYVPPVHDSKAEKDGEVVPCDDLPKSFVLTSEYGFTRVRLTSLNSATLEKRLK